MTCGTCDYRRVASTDPDGAHHVACGLWSGIQHGFFRGASPCPTCGHGPEIKATTKLDDAQFKNPDEIWTGWAKLRSIPGRPAGREMTTNGCIIVSTGNRCSHWQEEKT